MGVREVRKAGDGMMQTLTFEQLIGAVVVILIFVGAYSTLMNAIRTAREEKRLKNSPITELQGRVSRHDELLQKDKDRLDSIEARIGDMGTESTIMLRGVRALLSHEVNGNSTDKLEASLSEIDDYLIRRK